MLTTPNARIGDVLRQCGMVDERQLDEAHALSRREGIRIGEALVRMGALDRDRLAWALGVQFDLTYVDLDPDAIDWAFLAKFPLARLRELRLLPMSYAGGTVHAVVADPARARLGDVAEELFGGRELVVQLADEGRILALLGEARRRQQTPNDAFAPPPRIEDAAQWLDDCIEMLGRGSEHRFLVLEQIAARPHEFRIARPSADPSPPAVPAPLVLAILGLLPTRFAEELAAPGGMGGFLPALPGGEGAAPRAPVRVSSLCGTRGRLVVFERVPEAPSPPGISCVVRARDAARAKAALLRVARVSFEAVVDFVPPEGGHRFAVAPPPLRAAFCRRVAPALAAPWTLWEASCRGDADFAPFGCCDRLVVLQSDPAASGTVVEPVGDAPSSAVGELRAALAEVGGA